MYVTHTNNVAANWQDPRVWIYSNGEYVVNNWPYRISDLGAGFWHWANPYVPMDMVQRTTDGVSGLTVSCSNSNTKVYTTCFVGEVEPADLTLAEEQSGGWSVKAFIRKLDKALFGGGPVGFSTP